MTTVAGITQGSHSACVFYHKEKDVRTVVHRDDFTVLGSRSGLDWLREVIQRRVEVMLKARLYRPPPDSPPTQHPTEVAEIRGQARTFVFLF